MITIKEIREKLAELKPAANILNLDIETGKMIIEGATYSRKMYSPYLDSSWIKSPIWIVCAAWKWVGKPGVGSVSVLNDMERFKNNHRDDYHVVKILHALLSECDVLVGHNIDRFDLPQIETRIIHYGLPQLPPIKTFDTLKVARQKRFEANDLRYLTRQLGFEDKGESPDWGLISDGDEDEIRKCIGYNKQDVRITEALYLRLRSYAKTHPNLAIHRKGVMHKVCPRCDGDSIRPDKPFDTGNRIMRGYRCTDCHSYIKESQFPKHMR
ncbi:Ribonuclease H-like domain containing protein [uncultured Caudovirales phage]|uniref:Ribonuclease H-like domain containing protein n=1 Tax=uncultured Caudovirales phage TaxID=2100421 RepID=A0A6J5LYZ5_9CAUD|nr:Ribonuclease H-like domain containing protein [uncultured Caudovirales phage]